MSSEPLFRPGFAYLVKGEAITGGAVLALHYEVLNLLEEYALDLGAGQVFFLLGRQGGYSCEGRETPFFDVSDFVARRDAERPANAVGCLLTNLAPSTPPGRLLEAVGVKPGDIVLLFSADRPPAALWQDSQGKLCPAMFLLYQPAPATRPAPKRYIKIGAGDLASNTRKTITAVRATGDGPKGPIHLPGGAERGRSPVSITHESIERRAAEREAAREAARALARRRRIEAARRLARAFKKYWPVRTGQAQKPRVEIVVHEPFSLPPGSVAQCAYRRHAAVEPLVACPECGLTLCPACYQEAGGCITIGCSLGPWHDPTPELDAEPSTAEAQ